MRYRTIFVTMLLSWTCAALPLSAQSSASASRPSASQPTKRWTCIPLINNHKVLAVSPRYIWVQHIGLSQIDAQTGKITTFLPTDGVPLEMGIESTACSNDDLFALLTTRPAMIFIWSPRYGWRQAPPLPEEVFAQYVAFDTTGELIASAITCDPNASPMQSPPHIWRLANAKWTQEVEMPNHSVLMPIKDGYTVKFDDQKTNKCEIGLFPRDENREPKILGVVSGSAEWHTLYVGNATYEYSCLRQNKKDFAVVFREITPNGLVKVNDGQYAAIDMKDGKIVPSQYNFNGANELQTITVFGQTIPAPKDVPWPMLPIRLANSDICLGLHRWDGKVWHSPKTKPEGFNSFELLDPAKFTPDKTGGFKCILIEGGPFSWYDAQKRMGWTKPEDKNMRPQLVQLAQDGTRKVLLTLPDGLKLPPTVQTADGRWWGISGTIYNIDQAGKVVKFPYVGVVNLSPKGRLWTSIGRPTKFLVFNPADGTFAEDEDIKDDYAFTLGDYTLAVVPNNPPDYLLWRKDGLKWIFFTMNWDKPSDRHPENPSRVTPFCKRGQNIVLNMPDGVFEYDGRRDLWIGLYDDPTFVRGCGFDAIGRRVVITNCYALIYDCGPFESPLSTGQAATQPDELRTLIKQLDDDEWAVRDKAMQGLKALVQTHKAELIVASKDQSLSVEARSRIASVLPEAPPSGVHPLPQILFRRDHPFPPVLDENSK